MTCGVENFSLGEINGRHIVGASFHGFHNSDGSTHYPAHDGSKPLIDSIRQALNVKMIPVVTEHDELNNGAIDQAALQAGYDSWIPRGVEWKFHAPKRRLTEGYDVSHSGDDHILFPNDRYLCRTTDKPIPDAYLFSSDDLDRINDRLIHTLSDPASKPFPKSELNEDFLTYCAAIETFFPPSWDEFTNDSKKIKELWEFYIKQRPRLSTTHQGVGEWITITSDPEVAAKLEKIANVWRTRNHVNGLGSWDDLQEHLRSCAPSSGLTDSQWQDLLKIIPHPVFATADPIISLANRLFFKQWHDVNPYLFLEEVAAQSDGIEIFNAGHPWLMNNASSHLRRLPELSHLTPLANHDSHTPDHINSAANYFFVNDLSAQALLYSIKEDKRVMPVSGFGKHTLGIQPFINWSAGFKLRPLISDKIMQMLFSAKPGALETAIAALDRGLLPSHNFVQPVFYDPECDEVFIRGFEEPTIPLIKNRIVFSHGATPSDYL